MGAWPRSPGGRPEVPGWVPPTQPEPTEPTEPTEPASAPPTAAPTSEPPTSTPTPVEPTTPIFDEGLLTISAATGGGAPGGAAPFGARSTTVQVAESPVAAQWLITIKVPANNPKPVTIGIKYGAALGWPVSGNPAGWTCVRAADGKSGKCTAANPSAPATMPLSFTDPIGGSAVDRTFTVSAKAGRLYDDDSETLTAPPRTDENLLKIGVGKPDPDVYYRTLTVAPGTDRTAVTLKIQYGAALAWPIKGTPAGWKCSPSSKTCTALNPSRPAPLYAEFAVPDGSAAARTYSVSATAGLVSDTDSETLPGIRADESLLQILTPDPKHDPNPFVYNRFLKISGTTGPVTLEISWGRNLSMLSSLHHGWTCSRSTDVRRATCTTTHYTKPLNTEWASWPGNGPANTITVKATTPSRYDTDTAPIPPAASRR